MHDGEKSVLARATLNGLAGRVVARGPLVAQSSLCYRLMINSMKTCFAQQSIFVTPSINHMKQTQCRHVFPRKIHEKLF